MTHPVLKPQQTGTLHDIFARACPMCRRSLRKHTREQKHDCSQRLHAALDDRGASSDRKGEDA